jgi:uncharacterized repeat protein (TIGR03803 family)
VLYAFQGGSDGVYPQGSLIADAGGNLYGVTSEGGSYNGSACSDLGCGTVFEIQPDGSKITLHAFQGGSDGELPLGGLTADASGNLYGTTAEGGNCSFSSGGCGIVFKIAFGGGESVFYAFQGGNDGVQPLAGLIADASGNFYGTTMFGGATTACPGDGCGIVFKISPTGAETVLYRFQGGSNGSNPEAALTMDKGDNLYGTTYYGGGFPCKGGGSCGTAFKLVPDGTETLLFAFHNRHGTHPAAGLLMGPHGKLYGTATEGGINNNGVVFAVKK